MHHDQLEAGLPGDDVSSIGSSKISRVRSPAMSHSITERQVNGLAAVIFLGHGCGW
jgi:hypothetical protein